MKEIFKSKRDSVGPGDAILTEGNENSSLFVGLTPVFVLNREHEH